MGSRNFGRGNFGSDKKQFAVKVHFAMGILESMSNVFQSEDPYLFSGHRKIKVTCFFSVLSVF